MHDLGAPLPRHDDRGSIHDEIDLEPSAGVTAFRRVAIRRSRAALAEAGRSLALEARAMAAAARANGPLAPSFSRAHCPACAYRRPCIARSERRDVAAMLESEYRKRVLGDVPLPGLAGRGFFGPSHG